MESLPWVKNKQTPVHYKHFQPRSICWSNSYHTRQKLWEQLVSWRGTDKEQGNRYSTRIATDTSYPEVEATNFGLILSSPPFSTHYLTITLGCALQLWSESMKTSGLENTSRTKQRTGKEQGNTRIYYSQCLDIGNQVTLALISLVIPLYFLFFFSTLVYIKANYITWKHCVHLYFKALKQNFCKQVGKWNDFPSIKADVAWIKFSFIMFKFLQISMRNTDIHIKLRSTWWGWKAQNVFLSVS